MILDSRDSLDEAIPQLKEEIPLLEDSELKAFVRVFLDKRQTYLNLLESKTTPLYVMDKTALLAQASKFRKAFEAAIPKLKIFYAVKSNSHPFISETLVAENFGLDVSSGIELKFALDLGAEEIVFSGPGKSDAELRLAVENADRVMILMDSLGELRRLNQTGRDLKSTVTAGVRLSVDDTGIWRKFGIPIAQLPAFFEAADDCHYVDLLGLQFHLSWNMNAGAHERFLSSLGQYLRRIKAVYRQQIRFIDIGGGFWPEEGEWLQPQATPLGKVRSALSETRGKWYHHYKNEAIPISEFADNISLALKRHLPDDMDCIIFTEPGRWLCHDCMHILLGVADRKADDLVITDGGTNAVGWDRFESDYFPIINLSRPSLEEHACLIAGSLCTPHDIWGYSYFGESIDEGDILLVPNQGAYTYSLRQNFIKPLPQVVYLDTE